LTADEVAQMERDKTGGGPGDKVDGPEQAVSTKTATGATKRKSEGNTSSAPSKKSKRAASTPEDDDEDDE
jgi:hypothetical protein